LCVEIITVSLEIQTKHTILKLLAERIIFRSFRKKLRKATISWVMSVHPSVPPSMWDNSALTGQIPMKFGICVFFKLSRSFKFL